MPVEYSEDHNPLKKYLQTEHLLIYYFNEILLIRSIIILNYQNVFMNTNSSA